MDEVHVKYGEHTVDVVQSEELDRRIQHSETRIRNWVLSGIIANLAVFAFGAVSAVFSLGQLQYRFEQALDELKDSNRQIEASKLRIDQIEIQQALLLQWLQTKGYQLPNMGRKP